MKASLQQRYRNLHGCMVRAERLCRLVEGVDARCVRAWALATARSRAARLLRKAVRS